MIKLQNFLNSKYFVAVCFGLIAIIAFCLGRLSKIEEGKEPIRIVKTSNPSQLSTKNLNEQANSFSVSQNIKQGEVKGTNTSKAETADANKVVASKNGTKYHYPWCPGAKQISEKNKIVFNSIEEARAAGFTPASNCKGLK